MTQRAGGRPRPGLVSGHRRNEVLIRATTQKNFESDVLNGKRPSARHAPCKAPAEVPRPQARQSREVSERLPRRRGTEWVGAGFFPGSRKCYGTGQWGGVRTFANIL